MEIITSRNNKQITDVSLLIKDALQRKKEGLCVAEGVGLCTEAILSGVAVELFCTPEAYEKYPNLFSGSIPYNIVQPHVFLKISQLKNSQGVCCVCRLSVGEVSGLLQNNRYVALCNIQNPENAGAIIRSAVCFGFDGVIVCDSGADITSCKTVRASAGAVFKIPIFCGGVDDIFSTATACGLKAIATAAGDGTPLEDMDIKGGAVVFIGNEGAGLKDEIIKRCSDTISIDIDSFESLNAAVAAGIILYEFRSRMQ